MKTIKKDVTSIVYPKKSQIPKVSPEADTIIGDLLFVLCDRLANTEGYYMEGIKKVTVEMEVLIK